LVRAGPGLCSSAGRDLQLVRLRVRRNPRGPDRAVRLGHEGHELDDVVRLKLSDQAVVGEDHAVVGIASVDCVDQDRLALGPGVRVADVDAGGADDVLGCFMAL
jgi:hypothetical protein